MKWKDCNQELVKSSSVEIAAIVDCMPAPEAMMALTSVLVHIDPNYPLEDLLKQVSVMHRLMNGQKVQ